MKVKEVLPLLAIFLLAATLRFYRLGENPPSLNLDEVAIGYNAYSILKTGRDEYGEKLPLAFRSHDDYKPPLYIYLTVPSIAVFGLNEFGVRLPSALAGTLTVLVTYFLVDELFTRNKWKMENGKWTISLPALSALLLAVSPWHLQFSRAGFETNVAIFFVTVGVWAFLRGMRTHGRWWLLCAVSFALSLYTYQTARLFIPLFALFLLALFFREIRARKKEAIHAAVLVLLLILPLIPVLTSRAGVMRFQGTSVFQNPGLVDEERLRELRDAQRLDRLSMILFHNRNIAAVLTVLEGYLKHFQPDVLFLGRKGPPYNYFPNVGLLYFIELPLILIGVFKAWRWKSRMAAMITGWILTAPLAAALTWDVPSATRTAIVLPSLQILTAVGVITVHKELRAYGKTRQQIGMFVIATLFLWSVGYGLHQYHVHAPIEFAEAWQYGYEEAVRFTEKQQDKYERIIVSTNLKQPQNFFAFYLAYDPRTYIFVDGGTVSGGFLESRNAFGPYEFHLIDYDKLGSKDNILMVDLYRYVPDEYRKEKMLKIISLPTGEPYIVIAKS